MLIRTRGSNVCESFFVFSCMNDSVGKHPTCLLVHNKSLKYEWSAFLLETFVFSPPECTRKELKFFVEV